MRAIRWLLISSLVAITACGDNLKVTTDAPVGPTAPECRDGIDDDGDGDIDFPDDLGCDEPDDETENSPPKSKCSDNRDNDGDGMKDYPLDPGCAVASDDDETDDCPSGPNCPQCSNNKDDDFNGLNDYPDDQGCDAAGDTSEFVDDPNACGVGLKIKPLPASGVDTSMLDVTSASNLMTTCGGGGGAPGIAYVLLLTEPKVIVASTDDPITTADTNLSVRSGNCTDMTAVMGCNDNISTTNRKSKLTVSLPPGTYYLIVEGYDALGMGAYKLTVQQFAGEGATCTMQSDCGPGLLCRIPVGQTQMVCAKPVCNDGLDDDADGKIDFPNDPGCVNADDATENDTCPAGPGCPQCGDGIDNDLDSQTDFPNDPACTSASGTSESCVQAEAIVAVVSGMTPGTTVGQTNDYQPSCASATSGPDVALQIDLPKMQVVNLNLTTSYDSVHVLLDATCNSSGELVCRDPTTMTVNNLSAGRYFLVVDGYFNTSAGAFTLVTSGVVAPTGSCEGALFASGALTCATGTACGGPIGARTCRSECSDGIDNNGDGKIDFPNDPGCASEIDAAENTVCPGATCPACSNTMDDDTDTLVDYPADFGCVAAGGTTEAFCAADADFLSTITMPTTAGTLVGKADNFDQSCQGNTGNDVTYALLLPVPVKNLVLDTEGSASADTVLSIKDANCGAEFGCDDDGGTGNWSLIKINNVLPGAYAITVDAYASNNDPFTLHVKGTVAAGTACTSPLFTSGVLVCSPGQTCTAGTCQ